jgi:DUF438 domain-containing protein
MAKTPDKANASRLAEFLRRIDGGGDMKAMAKDAGRITENFGLAEMAAAERSLLDDGYAPIIVNQLSTAFVLMRRYGQQISGPQDELQDGHILQRVAAEHGIFRCLAAELREAAADMAALECLSDTASEYRRFVHAVDHLGAMKEHFEREDDVILPYLRKFGWASLCVTAESDHVQLRVCVDYLTSFATGIQTPNQGDFQTELAAGVGRFCSCLSEHLSFEEGLLWPIALVVIDDPAIWRNMKVLCEEIGYCGIHAA